MFSFSFSTRINSVATTHHNIATLTTKAAHPDPDPAVLPQVDPPVVPHTDPPAPILEAHPLLTVLLEAHLQDPLAARPVAHPGQCPQGQREQEVMGHRRRRGPVVVESSGEVKGGRMRRVIVKRRAGKIHPAPCY